MRTHGMVAPAEQRARSALLGGAGLLVATLLAWTVVLAFPSRTAVQVVITDDGAMARVNGATERLVVPAAERTAAGHLGWYLAGPTDSLYYQPADPSAPLQSWGRLGEWLQTVRPATDWQFSAATTAGGVPYPADHWQRLPGPTVAGARAALDPLSSTPPGARIDAELIGGRVSAGVLVRVDAAGNGYAFVLRPERRGMGWWRVTAGVPTMLLDSGTYRPAFWASVADLMQEFALALTGAVILTGAAVLLAALATLVRRRSAGDPGARFNAAEAMQAPPAPAAPSSITGLPRNAPAILVHNARSAPLHVVIPLIFGLLGLGAALAVCLGPLEGIPHIQDDVAYLWQAKIFALGRAWVPAPPFQQFFEAGFVLITDGRWFTKYPPGWPLLLAPGVWAGLPWLINPLCAGLSLALVYATGRRLYGPAAAFWAALLGLTSPFFLFMSGSFMSHPSTMLALAAALYCFVRLKRVDRAQAAVSRNDVATRGAGWALGVGFCLGWAFISREATAVGVALPFVLWALADGVGAVIAAVRSREAPERGRLAVRRLAPYGLIVLGALPPLLVLGAINQALLGSPFELAQALVGTYDRLGFGPGFGPEAGGHTPALGLYNALVYIRTLAGQLFGWPPLLAFGPLLLALAAMPTRPWRAARWDLFLFGGFLGLAGIYFAWWSATTIFGPRYWYEALPFLLLLSGRGIALLGRAGSAILAGWRRSAPPATGPVVLTWSSVVPAVVAGILILFDLVQVLPAQARAYTGYDDVDASSLRRVAAAHLDRALVFVALQPAFPRRDYGKVFFANDPLLRGPVIYARDIDPVHNRALVQSFPGRQPYYLPLSGPPHPGVGP